MSSRNRCRFPNSRAQRQLGETGLQPRPQLCLPLPPDLGAGALRDLPSPGTPLEEAGSVVVIKETRGVRVMEADLALRW